MLMLFGRINSVLVLVVAAAVGLSASVTGINAAWAAW